MYAFRCGFCHFCLSFNILFQPPTSKVVKSCLLRPVCLHLFLTRTSSFTKESGRNECTALFRSCGLGDRSWRSFGSCETAQRGLEFNVASTSVSTVANTSSSTDLSSRMAFIAVRVLLINLSHTPLAKL